MGGHVIAGVIGARSRSSERGGWHSPSHSVSCGSILSTGFMTQGLLDTLGGTRVMAKMIAGNLERRSGSAARSLNLCCTTDYAWKFPWILATGSRCIVFSYRIGIFATQLTDSTLRAYRTISPRLLEPSRRSNFLTDQPARAVALRPSHLRSLPRRLKLLKSSMV